MTFEKKITFKLIFNIQQEFEVKGYQTLLFEDAPNMATFNYLRPGFENPPTSYYLRPYNIAIDKHTDNYCYLDELEVEVILLHNFLRTKLL